MAALDGPPSALATQLQASDPGQSAWVSANAGSGKTHVLASRVIRLLLQGVAPSKILCLTFTKAAAANMAARIFDTLASWTQFSDTELQSAIAAIGTKKAGIADLAAARTLFARAVETPGGLKIQTIHAFCERLLHLFPFEANVPSRFEVADDLRQAELLQHARREVLAEAGLDKGALGGAVQRIAEECGPDGFEDLIKEALAQRAVFRAGSPDELIERLRRSLSLTEGRDAAAIEHQIAEGGIAPERWSAIADVLDRGTKTDQECAAKFRKALLDHRSLSSGGSFDGFLNSYRSIFFTTQGDERARLITNGLANAYPEIEAELRAEQQRLKRLCDERRSVATLERTRALIDVASAIIQRYGAEKATLGILDFEDLIERALTLLERSDARWVLYKLDAGIDHILVDEAQDTSQAQWKILERLTAEFSSGLGQSEGPRTFFAVGDEKQSIFSFQGAAPKMFDTMRRHFESCFTAAKRAFAHVRLNLSFRSAPGVLSAIDKIFEHGNHRNGLIAESEKWMPHEARKHQLPALVELWPLVSAPEDKHPDEWMLPLDLPSAHDPANILADRIAQKIKRLIEPGSGEVVHDSKTLQPRPVRPGDILILVRKRSAFFEAMIRSLRANEIPTAGADRLDLTNHIAVADLIAAGRASLLPQDDLTLACVLKSPLFGLTEDDLLALAPSRAKSLIEALQASPNPAHAEAAGKLARWRVLAAGSPFHFYARILGADGGRRAIEARLGAEARDAIDEFLRLALAHEEANALSLANFLNELSGLDYSIKRDMEAAEDAVRVMTVHAAKGLEAKIVFLPDTCSIPSPLHDPKIFVLDTKVPGQQTIAWSPKKDLDCEVLATARSKARDAATEEYRRLLYVALSRAEERLYIAGFCGANGPNRDSWANMIEAALASVEGIEEAPAFWNSQELIRRLVSEESGTPASLDSANASADRTPLALPEWLRRPAPSGGSVAPIIRPSNWPAPDGGLERRKLAQARREAMQRGRLIHQLLEHLPGIAEPQRHEAALAFLLARAPHLDEAARQRLAQEMTDLIALPELVALFGPNSKAEVAVVGSVEAGAITIPVNGRVDRIGEAEKEIIVADYKTGAPCRLESIPAPYLTQMALYRAVLAPLWPGKRQRMLLIWTEGPQLLWLPPEMLDAALAARAKG